MKMSQRFLRVVLLLSLYTLITQSMLAIPAFPGAEGGGANSTGGRGGSIYEVTNLNDSGAGSFRYGLENAAGARTIIFKVGGIIQLNSSISVSNKSCITIAGQTAPGGGITIGGENITQSMLYFTNTNNIIIRYVRFRKGGSVVASQVGDCVSIGSGCYNIIVDHCSISWSADENMEVWSGNNASYNVTMQWCISSEGKTPHSCGFLAGSDVNAEGITNISIHHNLFAHNNNRNPELKVKSGDIINNIVYNWGWWATGLGGGINVDIIGNLYKCGPSSGGRREVLYKPQDGTQATGTAGNPSIYFSGNIGPHNNDPDEVAWNLMLEMTALDTWGYPLVNGVPTLTNAPSACQSLTRRNTVQQPITINSATDLESLMLNAQGVGASRGLDEYGNWVIARDEIDARVINEYFTTGGCLSEEFSFPCLNGCVAYTDSDHDGMPDAWENLYGLDPANSSDRNADYNGDGYSNLEEFINGADPVRVLQFSLNESSGTQACDASGNFTANLCNGLSFTNDSVAGIAGTALEFDGINDFTVVYPCPSYSGDFTWAAWIKFSDPLQGFGIISTSPSVGNIRARVDIGPDGKLKYGLYDSSWAEKNGVGDNLADGKWHHVAVTFDRDGCAKAYVDGMLKDDTLYIAAKAGVVVGTHYIGYESWGTTKHFNGAIDDVKEYSRVLTAEQIEKIAKNVPAHFSLDESSGTQACDASGNFTANLCNGLSFTTDSVAGVAGTALEFDGINDFTVVYPCPIYSGDFTWAAWIKFSDPLQGFGIISTSPSAGNIRARVDIGVDGKLKYGLYDSSWAEKTGVGNDLSDGEWHHVAVTFDRDGCAKSYVDGVLKDDTLSIAAKTGVVAGTHYIGYESWGTTKHFNGAIDDVKEYNRVLTADEIDALSQKLPIHFPLNESSGSLACDASGNFTASLNNGLSFTTDSVAGVAGTALEFDGSDDFTVVSPCPVYSDDFTWAAWIRFSDPFQGFGIISTSPSFDNIGARIIVGADGKLQYGLYNGSWAENNGVGNDLSDGEWHHVAVTFDRDGCAKAYVDGILKDDTLVIAAKSGTVVGTHYIGYESWGGSKYFNGVIDEVREYKRVLTLAEIERLAKNVPIHFSFNETSGSQAYDSSGNFIASLNNGLSFTTDSVTGGAGTALEFDGSDDFTVVSPCPVYSDDFTWAAWIKFSDPLQGFGIISTSPSSGNIRARIIIGADGKLQYGLYNSSWAEKNGVGNNLADGVWHHVAVTFDRDGCAKAYVDGVLKDDTLSIAAKNGTVVGTHYIGYESWSVSKRFNGIIDEVMEYKRVLTADEIYHLVNQ